MCEIICVTQSSAVSGDFIVQLEKIAAAGADKIILREKQLSEEDYISLAEKTAAICRKYGTVLCVHTYMSAALAAGTDYIHMSFKDFSALDGKTKEKYHVGVSVHSLSEAMTAEKEGADCIIAGHIFPTDCKKGLPPRGLGFLSEICGSVKIPVYAIGGITPQNAADIVSAGARGVCIMSGLMKAENPQGVIESIHSII